MRNPLVNSRNFFPYTYIFFYHSLLLSLVLHFQSISCRWRIARSVDAHSSTRFTDFMTALTIGRPLLAPSDFHSLLLGGGSVDFPELSPLSTFPVSYLPSSPTLAKYLIIQVESICSFWYITGANYLALLLALIKVGSLCVCVCVFKWGLGTEFVIGF